MGDGGRVDEDNPAEVGDISFADLGMFRFGPALPPALAEAVARDRLVVFAGAGISRGAGLPLWEEFIRDIEERLAADSPSAFAQWALDPPTNTSFQARAEWLRRKAGEKRYLQACRDVVARQHFDPIPRSVLDLVALPCRAFITTNWDKLLEVAYYERHRQLLPVLDMQSLGASAHGLLPDARCLVKLHGDVDTPSRMVVSNADYARARDDQALAELLREFASSHTILFVGTSLTDSHVVDAVVEGARDAGRVHYWVTESAPETLMATLSGVIEPILPTAQDVAIERHASEIVAQCRRRYAFRRVGGFRCERSAPVEHTRALARSFPDTRVLAAYPRGHGDGAWTLLLSRESPDGEWFEGHDWFVVESTPAVATEVVRVRGHYAMLYPATVLAADLQGWLLESSISGNGSERQSKLELLDRESRRELIRGWCIDLEDIDGDGEVEVVVHRDETLGARVNACMLPLVYRWRGGALTQTTFETRIHLRVLLDAVAEELLVRNGQMHAGTDWLMNAFDPLEVLLQAYSESLGVEPGVSLEAQVERFW